METTIDRLELIKLIHAHLKISDTCGTRVFLNHGGNMNADFNERQTTRHEL